MRLPKSVIAIIIAGLAACSGSDDGQSSAAAHTPTAATTSSTATVVPTPVATPSVERQVPAEYCNKHDGFCVTFDGSVIVLDRFPMKTRLGNVKGTNYAGGSGSVIVYKPKTTDAWKALRADRGWSWNPEETSYLGHPAILNHSRPDNPRPGDTQINMSLKVYKDGKVYHLSIVAPNGKDQAWAFFNTLRFTG